MHCTSINRIKKFRRTDMKNNQSLRCILQRTNHEPGFLPSDLLITEDHFCVRLLIFNTVFFFHLFFGNVQLFSTFHPLLFLPHFVFPSIYGAAESSNQYREKRRQICRSRITWESSEEKKRYEGCVLNCGLRFWYWMRKIVKYGI